MPGRKRMRKKVARKKKKAIRGVAKRRKKAAKKKVSRGVAKRRKKTAKKKVFRGAAKSAPKSKTTQKRISVGLPAGMVQKLDKLAAAQKVSRSTVVHDLLKMNLS